MIDELDRRRQRLLLTNINQLWDVLNQEGIRIDIQTIQKLRQMLRICEVVIKVKAECFKKSKT